MYRETARPRESERAGAARESRRGAIAKGAPVPGAAPLVPLGCQGVRACGRRDFSGAPLRGLLIIRLYVLI